MRIAAISAEQHAEFLALINAEIRPSTATTRAEDDFPLALDPGNLPDTLGITDDDGRLVAGIACLVREYETSCGRITIGGVGSVVTHPDHRGAGMSSRLQDAMLDHLRRKNVPLAVLWTDQPEIYAGRGFVMAGWEWHAEIPAPAQLADLPSGFALRPYEPSDAEAVARLYARHPLRTVRRPGDAARLYGMSGTTGVVAEGEGGAAVAAVFCGKGADFPAYVTEWNGPIGLVAPLLAHVRQRRLASRVLVPAGGEALVEHLVAAGGGWFAQPSGCWAVLDADALRQPLGETGADIPAGNTDARILLGSVDPQGRPTPGFLGIAVWGFDSV